MKLQTKIPITATPNQIDYNSQLLLLGSCFSENIGRKLEYFKFRTLQNPFGILFHPQAIENLIERAIRKKQYTSTDVFYFNERWQCFDAHSDLSDTSEEDLIKKLNDSLKATLHQIIQSSHIIITLGTAWAYRHLASGKIVANCHKVPQKDFSKELLSIDEIVTGLQAVIEHVQSVNKESQIIFTISPVRHLKDGFVENQRSKAHLITAVHEVIEKSVTLSAVEGYFPSYELQMDELRDYRFYEQDMVHPNKLAIDYIWEKFKKVWISEESHKTIIEVDTIQKGLRHRPFHRDTAQHQRFMKSLETKIINLQQQYHFMEFDNGSFRS